MVLIVHFFCARHSFAAAIASLVQKPSTLRRKLLKAASPEWLEFYPEDQPAPNDDIKAQLLKISPAQIDWLLQPGRLSILKKRLSTTQPARSCDIWCPEAAAQIRAIVHPAIGMHMETRFGSQMRKKRKERHELQSKFSTVGSRLDGATAAHLGTGPSDMRGW
ncbi:MAG: hypothetical protein ACTHLW_07545 [Verrucomicrobiota bacterium]